MVRKYRLEWASWRGLWRDTRSDIYRTSSMNYVRQGIEREADSIAELRI